jgi:hypothetical protein
LKRNDRNIRLLYLEFKILEALRRTYIVLALYNIIIKGLKELEYYEKDSINHHFSHKCAAMVWVFNFKLLGYLPADQVGIYGSHPMELVCSYFIFADPMLCFPFDCKGLLYNEV